MKKIAKIKLISILSAVCLLFGAFSVALPAFAETAENEYYICLSNENYRVRNANKMEKSGGEYYLFDILLSSSIDFYIADLYGTKYYAADGSAMSVSERGNYRYTVKFSPTGIYGEETDGYEKTDCHITYKFYVPGEISVTVDGENVPMTYNNYSTDKDLWYISSIYLTSGAVVEYQTEVHTLEHEGWYRILFTPGKTTDGNEYLFDENGVYGSGDDYVYRLFIEDAPRYFVTFVNDELAEKEPDCEINGEKAYRLERYENNTAYAEYRGARVFVKETDYTLKYRIYEELPNGSYRLIDDNNDEDTAFSKREIVNAGWYDVSFSDASAGYIANFVQKTYDFGGWYIVGNFNGWCFNERGELDLSDEYRLKLIEEADEDYNEDYEQYRITFTVTENFLKENNFEFYITDGEDRYMNLAEYIKIDKKGDYELIFSDEHIYGRGRRYYLNKLEEYRETEEVLIGTTADFIAFAKRCNASSEYSKAAEVYLTADLDFSGVSFVPVELFNGVFHGGYHTIKNITVGNGTVNSVFGTVTTDAIVERLNVENLIIDQKDDNYVGFVGKNYGTVNSVTVSGKLTGYRFVGGIAGYNGRTAELSGSSLDRYVDGTVKNCVSSAEIKGFVNVGGVCGYSDGQINGAKSLGAVIGKSRKVNTTPTNLGGIVGYSSGRISECENLAEVKADSSSLNVGGIVGLCSGDVYFSFNRAEISGTRYVGGIVGYYGKVSDNSSDMTNYFGGISYEDFINYFTESEGDYEQVNGRTHTVVYTVNNGDIKARAYAGGIVGYSETSFDIRNGVSDGTVEVTAGNYAGGIIGYGEKTSIFGCLSAGKISANGMSGGNYVGGIAGYGYNVSYSSSSAVITGSDYVGGIAGNITNTVKGNYTNVLIMADEKTEHIGDILGASEHYNEALAGFDGFVAYNYYVGKTGGIGGKEFGENSDYAAFSISSDRLSSIGVLSPYLAKGFASEYWIGGDSIATYPVLNYLVSAQETAEYGDDDEFEAIFGQYPEFGIYAEKYARISFIVGFMEWTKDNGNLYDDDGQLNYDNFELIKYIRVYEGETIDSPPQFRYAETKDGYSIYEGDKARYFVSFTLPEKIDGNVDIYAEYREIATTIADKSSKILVEGLFDRNTEVSLEETPFGYRVKFTLGEREIQFSDYTVKYFIGDNVEKYEVFTSPNEEKIASEVSGKYLKFRLLGGQTFAVREQTKSRSLSAWAWRLIGGAIGFSVALCAILIIYKVKRKKIAK